jgi:hypothetical protein
VSDTRVNRLRLVKRSLCQNWYFSQPATIELVSESTQQPLEHQLEEIGTQLAWVRDYL